MVERGVGGSKYQENFPTTDWIFPSVQYNNKIYNKAISLLWEVSDCDRLSMFRDKGTQDFFF